MLVFDLCNGTSFENLSIWKSEFLLQTESSFRSESPFVLVGTKCDREADRDVSRDEVLSWCEQNKIPAENYFEVSAKTNANVEEAFDAVLRAAMRLTYRQNLYVYYSFNEEICSRSD